MFQANLPERLRTDGYLTIPAREGGTGDCWFVTVLMVPLILYFFILAWQEPDPVITPVFTVMGGFLGWVYLYIFGSTLRFAYRRSRGWPGLHIDREGVYGSVVNLRGGRLAWADILAVDHHTTANSLLRGVAFAVTDRAPGKRGVRFRREVHLLSTLLPVNERTLVPLLRAAHERWAPTDNSPVLVDGRPVNLLTPGMALQEARLAEIQAGRAVRIDYRKGRMRAQLWFGVPLLLLLIGGMATLSIWSWKVDDFKHDLWVVVLITLLGVAVAGLMSLVLLAILRRWWALRSGKALYVFEERGLREPTHQVLSRSVPWSACSLAYIQRRHRSPDAVILPVKNLSHYTRNDRAWSSITVVLQLNFRRDKLTVEYDLAGLRSDEMCDLLNAAILRYR